MKGWFLAAFWLLFSCAAHADCLDDAAKAYRIDPLLIKAIRWVESRDNPNAVGPRLRDGNTALGAMQINTILLPELSRFGVRREHLFDECVNVKIGAWALAKCMAKFGPTGKAVGCYNTGAASKNLDAQERYALLVGAAYRQLRLHPDLNRGPQMQRRSNNKMVSTGTSLAKVKDTKEMKSWGSANDE